MTTPLQKMTLDQLYEAADQYADKYDDRFQKNLRLRQKWTQEASKLKQDSHGKIGGK